MRSSKKLAFIVLATTLAGSSLAIAEPVPALAPQAMPHQASQAIDSANQSAANYAIPLFDSRVLSIGLGALAGVLVYNLLPASSIVSRAVPGAVGRAATRVGVTTAARTMVASQLPMMSSAVIGALMGDYLYRKNNHIPGVPSAVANRISP
jgi:hypothetical protein